jgi:hypothetical protein
VLPYFQHHPEEQMVNPASASSAAKDPGLPYQCPSCGWKAKPHPQPCKWWAPTTTNWIEWRKKFEKIVVPLVGQCFRDANPTHRTRRPKAGNLNGGAGGVAVDDTD